MKEDNLVELSLRIKPFVPIPSAIREYLEKNLSKSRIRYSAEDWFCYSAFLGIVSFVVLFFFLSILFSLLGISVFALFGISVLMAIAVFSVSFLEPENDKRKYAKEFETDMGLALLVLSIDINSGRRFRTCLERVSTGYGYFSEEIRRALIEERAGSSLPNSLERIANSVDSILVKQGIVTLKNCYLVPNGESVKRIAESILKNNENILREHNAKSGMMSQTSTVFTVVFPTILVCLLMIGSLIHPPNIHPLIISTGIGLGFTLAAVLMYQYQLSTVPVFVKRLHSEKKEKFIESLRKALFVLGNKTSVEKYILLGIGSSLGAFVIVLITSWITGGNFFGSLLFSSVCGVFVCMAVLLYPIFQYSSVLKNLEDNLPVVLEQAAQFSEDRTEKIVETISSLGLGRISREFGKTSIEIKSGSTVEEALRKIYRDTGSELVKRASNLLIDAHRSGINMRDTFKDTAEYIRKIKYLIQEARSATASERITQIVGFLIAAGLFGIVVSMGGGMISLLNGTFFSADLNMIVAIAKGIRLNLLVQPFVISYSVSKLEGNPKKMLFYLPLLLIGGNLLFSFTRGFSII